MNEVVRRLGNAICAHRASVAHKVATQRTTVLWDIKPLEWDLSSEPSSASPQSTSSSTPTPTTPIVTMVFSEFPEFDLDDLTEFNDNNFCDDNFGFDGFNWDSSNVAGQSQPYTGVDVRGDLNNYPDFLTPTTAPISLYPTQEVLPEGGELYCASR